MLTRVKEAATPAATESGKLSRRQAARIAVKMKGGVLFIVLAEVLAVVAQDNHVLLVCESGSHSLRESMSVTEKRLKTYGFVRIHRSVLVNKVWVDEIRPYPPRRYLLRLRNGREFTVTRTYKGNLKALAELWIGNDALEHG